jgi:hypothetical protein
MRHNLRRGLLALAIALAGATGACGDNSGDIREILADWEAATGLAYAECSNPQCMLDAFESCQPAKWVTVGGGCPSADEAHGSPPGTIMALYVEPSGSDCSITEFRHVSRGESGELGGGTYYELLRLTCEGFLRRHSRQARRSSPRERARTRAEAARGARALGDWGRASRSAADSARDRLSAAR